VEVVFLSGMRHIFQQPAHNTISCGSFGRVPHVSFWFSVMDRKWGCPTLRGFRRVGCEGVGSSKFPPPWMWIRPLGIAGHYTNRSSTLRIPHILAAHPPNTTESGAPTLWAHYGKGKIKAGAPGRAKRSQAVHSTHRASETPKCRETSVSPWLVLIMDVPEFSSPRVPRVSVLLNSANKFKNGNEASATRPEKGLFFIEHAGAL